MSEYQYYEFLAIDRPLTEKEMRTLRSYSTRARITPTSFVNHYEWGNFKGDEDAWMEEYFDAFLYLANWGTHVLKLRLPSRMLPLKTARQYCRGDSAFVREKEGKVIVTFVSEDEEGDDWDTGEDWLASLVPVRAEIARGDLRALYLAWLLCVQCGEWDDADREPLVPPNLSDPSASLRGLAEFLRIDEDLLTSAALASASTASEAPDQEVLATWIARLPSSDKDEILLRLMRGDDAHLGTELLAQFAREQRPRSLRSAKSEEPRRRSVAELRQKAEELHEERRQIAAKKAAEDRARQEREAVIARAKRLDALAAHMPEAWAEVERFIAARQPKSYEQAARLLADLRDLAAREGKDDFRPRLEALRAAHARKVTLLDKLKKAGL